MKRNIPALLDAAVAPAILPFCAATPLLYLDVAVTQVA